VTFAMDPDLRPRSPELSQSLTHPLLHPDSQLARGENPDVGHPGENPPRQLLPSGSCQPDFQTAVPPLPNLLAGMPEPFANVSRHVFGKQEPHLPGLLRLADAERILEETPRIEVSPTCKVLPGLSDLAAAGQRKSLNPATATCSSTSAPWPTKASPITFAPPWTARRVCRASS